MAQVKIPYFIEKSNNRFYWQPGKALREAGWRPETLPKDRTLAIERAQELNTKVQQWRHNSNVVLPSVDIAQIGTMDWLMRVYKRSNDFKKLAPKTKKGYDQNMEEISKWFGDEIIVKITPAQIKRKYEHRRQEAPSWAQAIIVMMRILYKFAASENIVKPDFNPAKAVTVQKPRSVKTEADLWTHEDVAAFVRTADAMGYHSVGTAVMLNAYLGQRSGDVINWQKSYYKNGAIDYVQSKTGAEVYLPLDIFPHLKKRLEEEIARQRQFVVTATTIIVSETTGRPYKADNFRSVFARIRQEASKKHPSLKNKWFMRLRHTAIVRLDEAECTDVEISTITGHSPQSVLEVLQNYRVRTKKLSRKAFQKRLLSEKM